MKHLPDDVYDAMIDGLTALHLLRLPYAPAAKGLPNVAQVWEQAFLSRCEWPDKTAGEDVARLSAAFAAVAATADRWPLPKHVIDNLPPRKPPPALPKPNTVTCPPEIAEMLGNLTQKLTQ